MRRFLLFLLLSLASASGHAIDQIYGVFRVLENDRWEIVLDFDIGFAEGELVDDEPQKPREYLLGLTEPQHEVLRQQTMKSVRDSVLMIPGGYEMSFPDYAQKPYSFPKKLNGGAYLSVRLEGELPESEELVFELSEGDRPNFALKLASDTFITVWAGDNVVLLDGDEIEELKMGESKEDAVTNEKGLLRWFGFVQTGFRHVLPEGWDHVLFVIGLCLVQLRLRPVLWQSLVFTVAHSVTLGLAAAGKLPLEIPGVEAIIALSIAVMGFASVKKAEVKPWRYILIFVFGLVHGLGFAGALASFLQGTDAFLPALVAMNVGVELAQVAVVIVVLLVAWQIRGVAGFENVRKITAVGIGCVGLWLTIDRLF